ncbi:hypothetical protein BCR35DRAFT_335113 [Leucosporidium creatinivorum]|uniref:Uncharacterized protein n=1 Tax=Leucosporidium creatinivorum TaxID=106004 RepID=A0A1Y2DJR5_9BASI|nr:hypothetical protein BCR35DRAFT_335113 [Leucosporidium creatinivorum]
MRAPIIASGQRPQIREWSRQILERDEAKRQTCRVAYVQDNIACRPNDEVVLRKTFGHQKDLIPHSPKMPFLRIMFDQTVSREMHSYVTEAVRIMLRYGNSHTSFIPLLWAGLRDWETSSAWTRGKVLLVARNYREAVERGKQQHAHQKTNELLASMGLEPSHSLAHLPSLSARQARRNGISERELRARWA